ncbi:MAG: Rieske 2Fe-2S domain-containing protein [Bacteroidota bacterium]
MISRRTFIKSTAVVAGSGAMAQCLSTLIGCAPSARTITVPAVNNKIVLMLSELPELADPGSYVKIMVHQHPHPIYIFSIQNEYVAILSTCTHNGCEVRKLRGGFECPCHSSEYDLWGNVKGGPAPAPLERFNVERVGDRLEFFLEGTT